MRTTLVSQLGKPNIKARPAMARPRLCPACGDKKAAVEFRQSNRNSRLNIICWQCRHDKPKVETEFYGVSTRRQNSPFRRRFWAIHALLKKRRSKKEVNRLKGVKNQAVDYLKFPERVAAIVGKTYAVRGDDFKLADDEALTRIRDLLDELDEGIIERNKNKRLSR